MTINESDERKPLRTQRANEVRMRKSEQRWADHLRSRGYTVVPASGMACLTDIPIASDWGTGFVQGVESVIAVSESLRRD